MYQRLPCRACSQAASVCQATWIMVRAVHMRLWALSYDARLDTFFDPGYNTHNATDDSKRDQLRVLGSLSGESG